MVYVFFLPGFVVKLLIHFCMMCCVFTFIILACAHFFRVHKALCQGCSKICTVNSILFQNFYQSPKLYQF